MESLKSRLQDLVKASHGGNVRRAATQMGLKQQTLDRIHRGVVENPRADALTKIAGFYGTTTDWLILGKGTPPEVRRPPGEPFAESRRWHSILESLNLPQPVWEETRHLPWQLWNFITMHDPDAVLEPATANARIQPAYDQVSGRSISNWSDALEALIEQRGREKIRQQFVSSFTARHSAAGKAARRQLEALLEIPHSDDQVSSNPPLDVSGERGKGGKRRRKPRRR